MPYTPLPAKTAPAYLNLSDYDAIKGNFEASAPDLYTAKGDLAPATGADAAARLAVGPDDSELTPDASQTTGLAWQIRPAARVYNNAAIDPATSTWVSLTFNSERFDTDTVHSTSSNTSRLTVPANGAGLYSIGACVELDTSGLAGTGGQYGLRLLLNGTTTIARKYYEQSSNADLCMAIETLYALSASDYVEVQVYTTTDVNVLASGNYSPEFWMNFERRQ